MKVAVLLFDDFETLDVFGPVEIFGRLKEHYQIEFYSEHGGLVKNNHGVAVQSESISNLSTEVEVFVIPGGWGTRKEVHNAFLIQKIKGISMASRFVHTICTGSALLAKTGLLDSKRATSNKRAFDWVITQGDNVNWIKNARWTKDGKYYTSAGVSAGMDMTLGFLRDMHGIDFARKIALDIEYRWHENMEESSLFRDRNA
jgi:putative intracellular protease/amidase